MQYFPLTMDRFEHQFGIRALENSETIVEATQHYTVELALKRQLLQQHRDYYFLANKSSLIAQDDVVDLVVGAADWLADGVNTKTAEPIEIDDDAPLLSISRHVQEDLTIISGDSSNGHPLVAGCVTFPSGWCIEDKLGQSILDVHTPVPEFDAMLHPPTRRLMDRLKVGRPVCRMNWGVRASAALDQSPRHQEVLNQQRAAVNADNAGYRCYFRVERQTLARLANSGDILFAIHTHQSPLSDLSDQEQVNLLGVLQSCPAETLRYKGITPMLDAVVDYLRA